MKILVLSDTHFETHLEKKKYHFLEKLINSVDQVIIAGDFWEGMIITFDDFVNSPWKGLFPLFKKKHTVYVYGNHDPREFSDQRVSLFSENQTEAYAFKSGKTTYVVQHGHQFKTIVSFLQAIGRLSFQLHVGKTVHIFGENLEKFILQVLGIAIHHQPGWNANKRIKEQMPKNLKNTVYICGHTHAQEVDLAHNYANTGLNRFGLSEYIIIEDGKLTAHQVRYEK